MKCIALLYTALVLGFPAGPIHADSTRQDSRRVHEVRTDELRQFVADLASERMAGRLTGTDGERLATEYAAAILEKSRLEPAGDNGTFFQSFAFTAGLSLGPKNVLEQTAGQARAYAIDADWRPLTFSQVGDFAPAGVVFAGYGIVAPAVDEQPEYDSYAHLDVQGQWVLVLRYLPEDLDAAYRQHLNRYASLRYKAMVARDRGARGLIITSGPKTTVKEQLVPLVFDASLAGSSIGAVSVTDALAEEWLQQAGRSLKEASGNLRYRTAHTRFQPRRSEARSDDRYSAGETPGPQRPGAVTRRREDRGQNVIPAKAGIQVTRYREDRGRRYRCGWGAYRPSGYGPGEWVAGSRG